ncbi:putative 6-phosphogluconolactonase 1 [Auxenochlorella protothecoides]|uniref:Putative 6-phosphogluconolactonase 1 n=1 Tax=Auxenochlorella protothecoides TaxID=3075 RepID=A0A087SQP4_AUXPR|nr:putative 6-phosphogluconolactonase 1 [Auxenochlorella protothecoides]KFM28048.1 putative 6-phosphogluconolactonase 1 [Auxenochlorella protothecoides]
MAIDRVGAVVIATRQGGNVVYERFYEPFSEPEKGELREAMHQATAHQPPDSADEALGQYRSGRIVAVPTGELCFYAVGHGEYNELALSEILNALINIYKQLYRVAVIQANATSKSHRGKSLRANGTQQVPARKPEASPRINVISPVSQWPEGIPPAMGGHFMESGAAAPLSQSRGPGIDTTPPIYTYPHGDVDVSVVIHETSDHAAKGLADLVAQASAAAIKAHGAFTVALSGGSLVKSLAPLADRSDIDFSRWHVLFADERNVAHDSPDSNLLAAREGLLSKIPVPAKQVLAIREGVGAALAATHYAGLLLNLGPGVLPVTDDGQPRIDLVLLGVGPDGHVASIFPNTPEARDSPDWVLPITNSPKPPPERITLSLSAINAAANVAIVALGQGKAEIVQRVLEVQSLPGALPAQLVRPKHGKLTWVLDAESAKELHVADWDLSGRKSPFHRSAVPNL